MRVVLFTIERMTEECIVFVITDRNSKSGIFQISLIAKIESHVAISSFNETYDEDAAVIHVGSCVAFWVFDAVGENS